MARAAVAAVLADGAQLGPVHLVRRHRLGDPPVVAEGLVRSMGGAT
jgi:hypothetical protein